MKPVKRNVLLNPGPATTTDSVKHAMVVPDICPREKAFGDLAAEIQRGLVDVVHGGEDYAAVLLGGSGTAALEACIASVVPRGRKALIMENGAYGRRMMDIARRYSIDVVEYRQTWGDYPDLKAVDALLDEHAGKISHLVMVHHETTTGMLNPLKGCVEVAKQHGVEIIVDAMSSYAGIPIDVCDLGIDYLLSSANKCIQGMAGLSFVICKLASLAKVKEIPPRLYYLDLYGQYSHFRKEHQFSFTPPVQVLYALHQALEEFFLETSEGRHARYAASYETLVVGLRGLGFRLLLPLEQNSKLLTAIVEPDHVSYSYDRMHDYLLTRGFTIYPGKGAKEKTFRIANIGQINSSDITAFLKVLKDYLVETGMMDALYGNDVSS
jgi:2-aminoethylphosphonate aminotransferase